MKYQNSYRQTEREYKHKNNKSKRIILFIVGLVMGLSGYKLSMSKKTGKIKEVFPTMQPYQTITITPTPTVEATITPMVTNTPEPVIEEIQVEDDFNKADSVIATSDVRLRLDTNTDSFKLGVLPEGSVVNRLISDGDWDLIQYGDTIAYVHSDYTKKYDVDYNNEYYRIEQDNDIARTTTGVNFRLGPSTKEKDVFCLDRDEEVVVLGKAIPNNNPEDVWLLCRARGQIGFVNKKYTVSLKEQLRNHNIHLDDIKIQKMAYVKKDSALYDDAGNYLSSIEKYQLVDVLQKEGRTSLVVCGNNTGYINSNDLQTINGSFLSVDLSDQRISFYVDNDVAFRSKCTTGKNSSPTEIGFFKPYGKGSSHDFGHNDYKAKILWMPFNGGQGLHDASWEPNEKFGDPNYRNRSAGCVRLPDDAAAFIYDNVPQSTHVLVKK